MRIIAGSLGGRHLVSFRADHIRPTTDRVKETIFNRFMFDIAEMRVLDLYAGTGNLSFEALSRGAEYVESVESHRKSLQVIRSNQSSLGLDPKDGPNLLGRHVLIGDDVFRYLAHFEGQPFDIILIDPPFTMRLADSTMNALSNSKTWHQGTRIAIESSRGEALGDRYGALCLEVRKNFGDKTLSFFEVEAEV
jgi:16S rRNA (guanine966-N2)-methyltransferase